MKRYEKASEETIKIFDSVLEQTNIPNWVQFEVLSYSKSKKLIKIQKLSDLITSITDGLNFAIVINEEIFDQLPKELQRIAIEEILCGVAVTESDSIKIDSPDFLTYSGILRKHGHESVIILKESIKTLFDSKKQKEEENKKPKSNFKK